MFGGMILSVDNQTLVNLNGLTLNIHYLFYTPQAQQEPLKESNMPVVDTYWVQ